MKRLIAAMLAVMMIFMFTACKKSEPAPKEEPTKEVTETAEEPKTEEPKAEEKTEKKEEKAETTAETGRTTGIVETVSDDKITVYTDSKERVTFSVKDVKINNAKKIQSGDKITVDYKGTITSGDTSKCEITNVTSTEGNKAILKGTVKKVDKKKGVISLMSSNKEYDFDYSKVKAEGDKINDGDEVEVSYAGILSGTDTTHAYVKGLKVTKKAVELKAVSEKVWTTKKVAVRADSDADSDKIAALKKGAKLRRTGVLSNGWSRVTYKGKDRFVKSEYLTTKKPLKPAKGTVTEDKKTEKKEAAAKKKEQKEAKKAEEKKAKKEEEEKAKKEEEKKKEDEKKEDPAVDPEKQDEQPAEDEKKDEQPAEDEKKEEKPAEDEKKDEKPAEEEEKPAADAKKVKVDGVVTEYDDKEKLLTITTKDKKEMVFDVKKAEIEKPLKDAAEKIVNVEYIDNGDAKAEKFEAVKITGPVEEKAAETGSAFSGGSTMILILAVIAILAGIGIGISRKGKKA